MSVTILLAGTGLAVSTSPSALELGDGPPGAPPCSRGCGRRAGLELDREADGLIIDRVPLCAPCIERLVGYGIALEHVKGTDYADAMSGQETGQ